MILTNDQYYGLSKLDKWYKKYTHQFIEVSGMIGTGAFDLIRYFIRNQEFDEREIMYLSYDQKQVLELASRKFHAYYINGILYNYTRIVDFDTLPVVNPSSDGVIEYKWTKQLKKKIDPRYKLIIVFDSVLLNYETLQDIASFGLPVILIRDPMLIPSPDTYTFMRDANIILEEISEDSLKNPMIYFAHRVFQNKPLRYGNYDAVSIVPRKQMNLYNLKSSEMNITLSDSLRNEVNNTYREKILKRRDSTTITGEKIIISNNLYGHRLVNKDNNKVRVYLTKGMIGYVKRINKHALSTRYVPFDFKPECYYESFDELVIDRAYLNKIEMNSRQIIPDEITQAEYAYALTPALARVSHWGKVTIIADENELDDDELRRRLLYTAMTRAKESITLII